jgi:predicted transposase YdaD
MNGLFNGVNEAGLSSIVGNEAIPTSFAIIGSLRYDRAEIDRVLKEAFMRLPIEDIMQESSYVQAWHAQWREEGIEAGRVEGRVEGRAATVYEMVRRAAERHFPALEIGPELERITNLEALEDLCLAMHELPDAAAVQARLRALLPTNGHVNGAQS